MVGITELMKSMKQLRLFLNNVENVSNQRGKDHPARPRIITKVAPSPGLDCLCAETSLGWIDALLPVYPYETTRLSLQPLRKKKNCRGFLGILSKAD
jgi:hypothetical protein